MNPDANDNLSRGDTLPTMTQGGDLVGRRIKHELHKRTRRRRSAGERDKMEKAHTTTDETERTAWGASLPDDDEKAMDSSTSSADPKPSSSGSGCGAGGGAPLLDRVLAGVASDGVDFPMDRGAQRCHTVVTGLAGTRAAPNAMRPAQRAGRFSILAVYDEDAKLHQGSSLSTGIDQRS